MATNKVQEGKVISYTCGASESLSSGDVVFINGVPGVALVDIGNSETGSVAIAGVFEISKFDDSTHGAVFENGDAVCWDGSQAVSNSMFPLLGYAVGSADAGDSAVDVLLVGNPADAPVYYVAGEAISEGELLYPSGYDTDKGLVELSLADADGSTPAQVAWFIADADCDNGAIGTAVRSKLLTDIDTDSESAGDPVYLSETPGGWTDSAPSDAGDAIQQVGVVTESDSSTGKILFMLADSKAVTVT